MWWVNAIAKPTGYRSQVGPFHDPIDAAKFVVDNRPAEHWRNVAINLRQVTK